jgi:outer membrane protein TolC
MRRFVMLVGLTLVVMLETAPAVAAPPDTLRLSLDDCVQRAVADGEEMKLAEADLATARALYLEARSTALPRLSFNLSYTRRIESIFRDTGTGMEPFAADTLAPIEQRVRDLENAMPTAGLAGLGSLFQSTSFGSENSWIASLGFTQKVFQGGSVWNSIAAAGHAMRAAETLRDDRRRGIVLAVREAYLAALLADRGAHIADLSLQQTVSQVQRVSLRHETGNASEFVLLQAEVQRDNLIPVVKEAYLRREVANLDLRRLANIRPDAPLVLTTPLLDDGTFTVEPVEVDSTGLIAAALRNSSVVSAEQQAEARNHAVAVAGAERWPKFSLFANYSRQAYPEDPFPKSGDWVKDVNAGVMVEWSIFDGFLTKGAIQASKARRSMAQQNLKQAREEARLQVIRTLKDLERCTADLRARARTVELARRAFELANIRFEEGASDQLEVSDSRIAYQIAQTNEATARRDYFAALAQIERLTGRPLFTAAAPSGGTR